MSCLKLICFNTLRGPCESQDLKREGHEAKEDISARRENLG